MEKLLKSEIIEKVYESENLNKRLGEAIQQKDITISKLKNDNILCISKLELENQKLRADITALENQLENEKNLFKSKLENGESSSATYAEKLKDLQDKFDNITKAETRRVSELNELIFAYGAFIKNVQGALETTTLIQDKLIEKFTKE